MTTLDPLGPWNLEGVFKVPDCNGQLHFSTSHEQANITVIHTLKVALRVERGDDEELDAKGKRKKFDIVSASGFWALFDSLIASLGIH